MSGPACAACGAEARICTMGQPASTRVATEVLAGLVERVTFHNEENGFCVLRVKARGQRDLITVLGHAAMIAAGEFVQASGVWVNDHTHGIQFRASFLKVAAPTTVEGIEKYLGSGMIRGIGPVYARSSRSPRDCARLPASAQSVPARSSPAGPSRRLSVRSCYSCTVMGSAPRGR